MSEPNAWKVLSESEAPLDSFHDCRVRGMRWDPVGYRFVLELHYIVEWIEPADGKGSYRFLVSEARLIFSDADSVKLAMEWTGVLDAEIHELRCVEPRATPNGGHQRLFEVSFSEPDATLSLWSTGYKLQLEHPPRASPTPSLADPVRSLDACTTKGGGGT